MAHERRWAALSSLRPTHRLLLQERDRRLARRVRPPIQIRQIYARVKPPWPASRTCRAPGVLFGLVLRIRSQPPCLARRSASPKSPKSWRPASCVCGPGSPVVYLLTAEKVRSTVPPPRAVIPTPSRPQEAWIDRYCSGACGDPEGPAPTGAKV